MLASKLRYSAVVLQNQKKKSAGMIDPGRSVRCGVLRYFSVLSMLKVWEQANQRDFGMCNPALLVAAGAAWPSSFGNVTSRETALHIVIRPC